MTILIITITCIISIFAFNNRDLKAKTIFNPYLIHIRKEWWRFISYGLIHADIIHLLVNMMVLYSFGSNVEMYFKYYFGYKAYFYFLILYCGAVVASVLPTYEKQKNNIYYNAVGASGAVSAVLFSNIILEPNGKMLLFLIPFPIYSIVFGILYLVYSAYMAKRNIDNIGHDAHFYGAIFGIIFTILLKPSFIKLFIIKVISIFN